MKRLSAICFQMLVVFLSNAQYSESVFDKSRFKLTLVAMAGRSFFAANALESQSKFPTNEVRIQVNFHRQIAKSTNLIAGVGIGGKLKGTRVYPPGSTPFGVSLRLSAPLHDLEETVNSNNHYFIEMPLMAQQTLFRNRFSIGVGINLRHFFSSDGYYDSSGTIKYASDFLSNRQELGILVGFGVNLSKRVQLESRYFVGVTSIYSMFYSQVNGLTDFKFDVKNRFFQIGLDYRFLL